MCLNYKTIESEKRCSSILTCIERFHCLFQCRFDQQCAYLASKCCHEPFFNFTDQNCSDSFKQLQYHIPNKCFTNNHIRGSVRNFPCFDAADKMNIFTFFQKRECLFDKCISLLFFCTDIHNRNSRILNSNYILHINRTHLGKLYKM